MIAVAAANVAIDILSKDVQGKSIPDQTGEAHLKVGKVKYELTRWVDEETVVAIENKNGSYILKS